MRTTISCSFAFLAAMLTGDSRTLSIEGATQSASVTQPPVAPQAPPKPPAGDQAPGGIRPPGTTPPPPGQTVPGIPERPAPPPFVTPLWAVALQAAPSGQPGFDASYAYIPLKTGQLVATSLSDGHVVWTRDLATSVAPVAGEDLVFVAAAEGIVAVARADGSVRWSLPVEARLSAPMVWDTGWLFVATDDAQVRAIRASDGELLWKQATGSEVKARVAPAADRVYASLEDGRVMALSLTDGTTVWERRLGGTPVEILALDDRLFVGSKDNFFYCLDIRTGKVKWRWRTGADLLGAPVVDEARVYFMSLDNVLRALDRRHGGLKWQRGLTVRASGGPILVDDLLVVAGVSTAMFAFQAKDGKPAGSYTATAELDAPPHFLNSDGTSPVVFVLLTRDGRLEALQRRPDLPPPTAPAESPSSDDPDAAATPLPTDGTPPLPPAGLAS